MSLDVYLTYDIPRPQDATPQIFVREAGRTIQLTRSEWDARTPGREPVTCTAPEETTTVFSANITHNLSRMAEEARLYQPLWRPEELGLTHAAQLAPLLAEGLMRLCADPATYSQYNPANGWGDYTGLVAFVVDYLAACEAYPAAAVSVWR